MHNQNATLWFPLFGFDWVPSSSRIPLSIPLCVHVRQAATSDATNIYKLSLHFARLRRAQPARRIHKTKTNRDARNEWKRSFVRLRVRACTKNAVRRVRVQRARPKNQRAQAQRIDACCALAAPGPARRDGGPTIVCVCVSVCARRARTECARAALTSL